MRIMSTRPLNLMLALLIILGLTVLEPARRFRRAHDFHGIGTAYRARILSHCA